MNQIRTASLLLSAAVFGALTHHADAAQTIFLDFSSIDAELDKLTDAVFGAGLGTFEVGEKMIIKDEITSQVALAYTGYDMLIATAIPAVPHTKIDFGAATATPLTLGLASFDPFNTADGFTASVYTSNHSITIDEFPDAITARADQISQVATGLASTAIHEVGHTFGLDHYDAYGTVKIDPAKYADTMGFQNANYMATGETGLKVVADGMPEMWDTMPMSFSQFSKAKLEWGTEGKLIAAKPGPLTVDPDGPSSGPPSNNTAATATPLELSAAPISSTFSALVELAELDASGPTDLFDYFSVTVPTGAGDLLLSANTFSKPEFDPAVQVDTKLELISPDGASIEFSDLSHDDIHFSAGEWGSFAMAGGFDEQDSMILNVPVLAGETYFLKVSPQSPTGLPADGPPPPVDLDGFYHLFLTLSPVMPIPEPGGGLLAALSFAGLLPLVRRRPCRND